VETPAPRTAAPAAERPPRPAYGRFALELSAGRSWSRFGGADPIERVHTTANPALALDVTLPDVGAGFQLRAGGRVSYRYHALGAPPTAVRVYTAALERNLPGSWLQLSLGRFHSPDESYSGYWDGGRVRFGRAFGLGVLAGLTPDLWNQSLSLDRPRVTMVLDGSARGARWRWSGDASIHRIWSRSGPEPTHTFVGVSQSLSAGPLRLGHDVQLDQDPVDRGWRLSRLGARASLGLGGGAELRGSFTRRASYLDVATPPFFSDRRDRVAVGVLLPFGPARVAADVSRSRDPRGDATSYTGSLWLPLGATGRSGLDANASYWEGAFGRSWVVAPGLGLGLGAATLRLGYRYARSDYLDRAAVDHGGDLSLEIPTPRGTWAILRMRGQHGSAITSAVADLTLERRF
jgi:hypothetical protein